MLYEIIASCEPDLPILRQIEAKVELKAGVFIHVNRRGLAYSEIEAEVQIPRNAQVRRLNLLVVIPSQPTRRTTAMPGRPVQ